MWCAALSYCETDVANWMQIEAITTSEEKSKKGQNVLSDHKTFTEAAVARQFSGERNMQHYVVLK